jgi:hypothetical protein
VYVPDELVGRMISQQLSSNPAVRTFYNTDAVFHASVDKGRQVLVVVADAMQEEGIPASSVATVLQVVLDRMLPDRAWDDAALAQQVYRDRAGFDPSWLD